MELKQLNHQFSSSRQDQIKAIFANLFLLQNKIQTLFDNGNPAITIKQFMLLIMIRQSKEQLTFTQLGQRLGCSRQNIKKLAGLLERKGFVTITQNNQDPRASTIIAMPTLDAFFIELTDYHNEMLTLLFKDYTDQEIAQFFYTLTKLHGGIAAVEQHLAGGRNNEKNNNLI